MEEEVFELALANIRPMPRRPNILRRRAPPKAPRRLDTPAANGGAQAPKTPVGAAASAPRKPRKLSLNYANLILRHWLYEHRYNPYPSDLAKMVFSRETNLTIKQIDNWFTNARRRLVRPVLLKEGIDPRPILTKKRGTRHLSNWTKSITTLGAQNGLNERIQGDPAKSSVKYSELLLYRSESSESSLSDHTYCRKINYDPRAGPSVSQCTAAHPCYLKSLLELKSDIKLNRPIAAQWFTAQRPTVLELTETPPVGLEVEVTTSSVEVPCTNTIPGHKKIDASFGGSPLDLLCEVANLMEMAEKVGL